MCYYADMDEPIKGATVANLEEHRQQKLMEEHLRGLAFKFQEFNFDPDNLGSVDEGVALLIDEEEGFGVFMSDDDAEALGIALIQCAFMHRMEKKGIIQFTPDED